MKPAPLFLYVVNDAAFFLSHRLALAQDAAALYGARIALASAPALPADVTRLRELGIAHHPLPVRRISRNPFAVFSAAMHLLGLIHAQRPTLVHAVAMKAILLCAFSAIFTRRAVFVYLVTGMGMMFAHRKFLYRITQFLFCTALRTCFTLARKEARAVIVQNADDGAAFTAAGLGPSHLIASSGVDTARIHASPLPDTQPPIILMAARLLHSKGVADFAAAAAILKERGIAASCVLAGDLRLDSPDAIPEKTIMNWQSRGHLSWVGHVTQIDSWIERATLICYPSWYGEGVPRFLIEAAAHGRPVVTTDHTGCRDAIIPDESGVLVPVRNPIALADALQALLANPEKMKKLGAAARLLAQTQFSLAHVNAQTLKIYDVLIAQQA